MNGKNILLNERTAEKITNYFIGDDTLIDLSEFFYVFSDRTRLKIIWALTMSPMCVSDLSNVLEINQTTVSHQLKIMRSSGIVKTTRNGKIIEYSLKSEKVGDTILSAMDFLSEN